MNKLEIDIAPNKEEIKRHWYIGYTFPKTEKRIHSKLDSLDIISFLPLQTVIRFWSDRKKRLEVPVFPNYIFIYASKIERYTILKMKELIKYVSFDGKPAIIADSLIDSLKKMMACNFEVSNEEFDSGMPIRIVDGPLVGLEGVLVQRSGTNRLIVRIEALKRFISVDISTSSVVPIKNKSGILSK